VARRVTWLAAAGIVTVSASIRSAALPPATPAAVVLYNDRTVVLDRVGSRSDTPDDLWVRKSDLPRINEFELKPQGACRADVCVPVDKTMARGEFFDLSAFARKVGEPVVVDRDRRVWSFGEIPLLRGQFVESRIAPDFTAPDRRGRPVQLSSFRGRKVLVVTWASW
jgi:hypothetical protein